MYVLGLRITILSITAVVSKRDNLFFARRNADGCEANKICGVSIGPVRPPHHQPLLCQKKCSLQTSLLEICFQVLTHLHIFTTVSQRSFFSLHHDYDTGNDLQSGLITGNERLRRYASCKNPVVKIINKIGLPRKQE